MRTHHPRRHLAATLAALTLSTPAAVTLAGAATVAGVAAAATFLSQATPAAASQYTVDSCRHPKDGTAAPTDGWTASGSGSPYTAATNGCATDGWLRATFQGGATHPYGTQVTWQLTAPARTTLAAVSAFRSSLLGPEQPYGSPVTLLATDRGTLEFCSPANPCASDGVVSFDLGGANSFLFSMQCGGGPGGMCPDGLSEIAVRNIALTLNDLDSPQIVGTPSGSLMSPTASSQIRTLNFSATDGGSGLYRQQLLADGQTIVHDSIIDPNDGHCQTYADTGHFSYLVPCKTSASGTIIFDTATLTPGQHELTLRALDAAGNAVSYGPWPITVGAPNGGVTGNDPTKSSAGHPADNGANAGPKATVTAAWIRGRHANLTDRYNGAPTLRGQVINADTGQPIGGAILDVVATPAFAGSHPLVKTGLRTTPDGRFTLKEPLGVSSRTLQIIYRPSLAGAAPAGMATLTLKVRAAVQLRHIRATRHLLILSGRLAAGPFPKVGPVVDVEVRKGRTWQVFGSARATSRGHFTITYRPAAPLPPLVAFTFRARVRADSRYPYVAGVSRARRAVVR